MEVKSLMTIAANTCSSQAWVPRRLPRTQAAGSRLVRILPAFPVPSFLTFCTSPQQGSGDPLFGLPAFPACDPACGILTAKPKFPFHFLTIKFAPYSLPGSALWVGFTYRTSHSVLEENEGRAVIPPSFYGWGNWGTAQLNTRWLAAQALSGSPSLFWWPQQKTINCVAWTTLISHGFGGWEVQDQGAGRAIVWWAQFWVQTVIFLLPHVAEWAEGSRVSLWGMLIWFTRAPPLGSTHLAEAPPSNTMTLGSGSQHTDPEGAQTCSPWPWRSRHANNELPNPHSELCAHHWA